LILDDLWIAQEKKANENKQYDEKKKCAKCTMKKKQKQTEVCFFFSRL